ncbi:sulfotransferase [Paracoccus albus]|uniref:sulfotransferase n=1 Tax=Paracoccus albus TaxID=3017784 RepID=UPI0022F00229|nr:sulfotransferase [Paracoccus albus]WBU60076.1 hypothetical protein PAF20_15250 [Paracoccus albus]
MLPLVFVIGFNKCGTTSLHRMFMRAGHRSSHHRHQQADGGFVKIAWQMQANAGCGLPLLTGMEGAQIFSDMDLCSRNTCLSGIARFRELDAQYPGSRFILNTRNPLHWVNSRFRHFGGGYLRRCMAQAGISDPAVMRAHWLREWHEHHAAVTEYFASRPGQLLVFDIEADCPKRFRKFLPGFGLKPGHWRHHNRTPDEVPRLEPALAG